MKVAPGEELAWFQGTVGLVVRQLGGIRPLGIDCVGAMFAAGALRAVVIAGQFIALLQAVEAALQVTAVGGRHGRLRHGPDGKRGTAPTLADSFSIPPWKKGTRILKVGVHFAPVLTLVRTERPNQGRSK